MKAIEITDVKKISIINAEEPKAKPGYTKIKVASMGICGSDVHAYAGKSPNVTFPVVIGHEIGGIVEEIGEGSNANGIKVGDHVVLNPYIYCGKCYPCSQGRTNCCTSLKCLGVQTGGAMSEAFAHPTDLMVRLPDDMDWETAAVVEPAVIALHAIHNVAMKPGEHVVVVGTGCIGLLIGMIAMAKGGIPIMVDVVDGRLESAKALGITHVVNSMKEDAVARISEITNGRMAECVCEVSGNVNGIRSTLDYAAATGRIALTGWPNKEVQLPTAIITRKELQIRGSRTGVTAEFAEVIDMVAKGEIDIHRIISKVVDFDELPDAIRHLDEKPEDWIKVVAMNR